ncbi:HNH endonuclease [Demequina aurantiaca]|uniref:HNH endonuclease n=1 Tax=Demequina aurantiaca TaxID=676200 RepID=UPI00128C07C5|nr:HNH endonuclease [Demequina aurantiaca]
MDKLEDRRLRTLALGALDVILDNLNEFPERADLRKLDLPVSTPHLVDLQKGIWNPKWLLATLSVTSVLNGPYPDKQLGDGLWEYHYRAGGTEGDNRKLQRAADLEVDIVYFRETAGGRYQPEYPVRIVQNNPIERTVLLARKDLERIDWTGGENAVAKSLRSWATREVKVRKHQRLFRRAVIDAYASKCAVCALPVETLIDAAHIDADSSIDGLPVIQNGLALCKIHHYAYDSNIIGISPSGAIHAEPSILNQEGGLVFEHALKRIHKTRITVPSIPSLHPSEERLARRWGEFKKSAIS